MGQKAPQPTAVLVKRLQRVARFLDRMATADNIPTTDKAPLRARANTCWEAAGRLEQQQRDLQWAGYDSAL